jgi:hypothetical protein
MEIAHAHSATTGEESIHYVFSVPSAAHLAAPAPSARAAVVDISAEFAREYSELTAYSDTIMLGGLLACCSDCNSRLVIDLSMMFHAYTHWMVSCKQVCVVG